MQLRLLYGEVDQRIDGLAQGLLLVVLVLVDRVATGAHTHSTGLGQTVQVLGVLSLNVDSGVQEGDHGSQGLLGLARLVLDQIYVVLYTG